MPETQESAIVVMGTNDHRHCLKGWYPREHDGRNGVCYRWTEPEASFRLNVGSSAVAIRLMVAGTSALTGKPSSFSLLVNGSRLAHFKDAARTDFWGIVEAALPPAVCSNEVVFTILNEEHVADEFSPRFFVPDQYLGNGDLRAMGVMVAAIRIVEDGGSRR